MRVKSFQSGPLAGRRTRWKSSWLLLGFAVCLLPVSRALAQAAGSRFTGAHPDLSGFWELKFDSRNVPPAVLTSSAKSEMEQQYRRDLYAIRWCNHLGMPAMMQTSRPIDIRQGSIEVAIASEAVAAARHIYTDGRSHPDMATYDPQSNGHSIGHWEGETLMVDTLGFSEQGLTTIPGGGYRTRNSHLVERYQLRDGGSRLSVVFTWADPKVYPQPHTYEFRYYRAPVGTYARESFCDASDAERAKFLSESRRQ